MYLLLQPPILPPPDCAPFTVVMVAPQPIPLRDGLVAMGQPEGQWIPRGGVEHLAQHAWRQRDVGRGQQLRRRRPVEALEGDGRKVTRDGAAFKTDAAVKSRVFLGARSGHALVA